MEAGEDAWLSLLGSCWIERQPVSWGATDTSHVQSSPAALGPTLADRYLQNAQVCTAPYDWCPGNRHQSEAIPLGGVGWGARSSGRHHSSMKCSATYQTWDLGRGSQLSQPQLYSYKLGLITSAVT